MEAIIFGVVASILAEVAKYLKIKPEVLVAILCLFFGWLWVIFTTYGNATLVQQVYDFGVASLGSWGTATLFYERIIKVIK